MSTKAPTYTEDKERCKKFLNEFQSAASADEYGGRFKYLEMLQKIANRELDVLEIDLDDVTDYGDSVLAGAILRNTHRYESLFAAAVDEIDTPPTVEITAESVLDVFIEHRQLLQQSAQAQAGAPPGAAPTDGRPRYPPSLLRRYQVLFKPPQTAKPLSIRQVEAKHIGSLVTVEGVVIRSTGVKPMVTVATYACDQCGSEVYQEINKPNFMPLDTCTTQDCVANNRKGRLHLLTRGSKFDKFQEFKVQELASHVPTGHIPRTLTVYVQGNLTRIAQPGDRVTITGVFLPTPATGFRAIRAGLISDTYLQAHQVVKAKKTYSEQQITPEVREQIEEYSEDSEIYNKLSASIAPEIYGHDDVKKALLLLLVGGLDRKLGDGMKIRGDVNICLMGDPGVAKSQLLKKVADLAPRGVYTTGRGSSGAGLTAAVTRDPITNEIVLEGGALVLADRGVCCIDEFDKMEETDRTSIHEVMEQQTISIAKAGITTSLNARSAILAAANPLYGRYNVKKSATQNINLPAALLSRFDLIFLLLDRPSLDADLRLAHHITYVHTHSDFPKLDFQPLTKEFVRSYISVAKQYNPHISKELTDYITSVYVNIREEAQTDTEMMTFVSARTLLAILRLATALARLRFSNQVVQDDVEEALRLMHMSKSTLLDIQKEGAGTRKDPSSEIYKIIRNMVQQTSQKRLSIADAQARVLAQGYKLDQFNACLDEYEGLDIWQINESRTRLTIVNMS